ncbi:MAG: tRNA (adenosine(37)-N6)-threonylcarbamoyltransferase complex transferase subunit TsaD [Acidimicrobiia bacterium]
MLILGIESSCDETAVAIVRDGTEVLSSVVSSQMTVHERFGGVVPEIASRAHAEQVGTVLDEALTRARVALGEIDAVAACAGPGLAGPLLVGVAAGKSLAFALSIPYLPVHHHYAHMAASWLEGGVVDLPAAYALVSGGHTMFVEVHSAARIRVAGRTVDDAAGEAFDKVARMLGLAYPGGPAIDALAREGDPKAIAFPRPMLNDGLQCSFSGLKTAVKLYLEAHPDAVRADVAASFQAAVVEVIVTKLNRLAEEIDARSLMIGGGVAANASLRAAVLALGERSARSVSLPSLEMCTDNAAMIAAAGWWISTNPDADRGAPEGINADWQLGSALSS